MKLYKAEKAAIGTILAILINNHRSQWFKHNEPIWYKRSVLLELASGYVSIKNTKINIDFYGDSCKCYEFQPKLKLMWLPFITPQILYDKDFKNQEFYKQIEDCIKSFRGIHLKPQQFEIEFL
jgi:hypothetical protein